MRHRTRRGAADAALLSTAIAFVASISGAQEDSAILREVPLAIDAPAFLRSLAGGSAWTLAAPPNIRLELVAESVAPGAVADAVVRAHVRGEPESRARFVFKDHVVVGDVASPIHGAFEIRWTPAGTHVLRRVDRARSPVCGGALAPDPPAAAPSASPAPPAAPAAGVPTGPANTVIDVMVVYTPSAVSMAGGVSAIEATIESYVDFTNQAYGSSGATQELRLVHTAEISYFESGNSITDLVRLKTIGDGFMDGVHPLRDAVGADCVSLIATSGSAGVGYLMDDVSPAFASCAFSTIGHDVGGTAFAHELGHNMGCGHNNGPGAMDAAFCFSYGYRTPDNQWRTIMSNGPGTYVPHFSSPNVSFAGQVLGVDGTGCPLNGADNVTSLNLTADVVAGFR